MRAAGVDFFFNSWRLVPANMLWGLGVVAAVLALFAWPPLALLIVVLLVLPNAAVFRLAALIARGEPASLGDALDALHDHPLQRLALAALMVGGALVLLSNLVGGSLSASMIGWGIATLAGWGVIAGGCWLLCFWPILLDPHRPQASVRLAARLASLLVLAFPMRIAALALTLGVLLAASTVAFLMLFTVSFAYAALVACRYVLPAADRLEAAMANAQPALRGEPSAAGHPRARS